MPVYRYIWTFGCVGRHRRTADVSAITDAMGNLVYGR
jgi:hypothetical protein